MASAKRSSCFKQLSTMIVDGRGNEPSCFTLREADGDSSTMLLGSLAQAKFGDPLTRESVEKLCVGPTP